ncbi:MAG TPA: hypothetical protein VE616_16380 [Candidatus Udaeobacter sp.]|jgi:hypothetical protein|nr:hypothetical protein [Candidatus Udaeobacter sp.]
MTSAEDWARAIRVSDILLRGHPRAVAEDEPTLLVQRIARNPVLCGGPVEHFSQDIPIWVPKTPDEDSLHPIDVLYGTYDPRSRSINIFVNRIRQDAKSFGAEPNELLEIVRIHEYAHAVTHLGSRSDDVQDQLSSFGGGKKTAWSVFIEERTSWFSRFPTELHEFLAQALTYAALSRLSAPRRWERLREVFDALEAKQPPQYKLSSSVKQYAAGADWPLVLGAARGTIDVYRQQDFTLSAGLEALVCSAAEPRVTGDAP